MPVPDPKKYPADGRDPLYLYNDCLAVPVEAVKRNFVKYGLLDERVRFLKGWFKDSLPNAPIDRISLLRLDGDLYESTMDILHSLYHKVSPGGYVIVDDYGALDSCRAAIHDFRTQRGIAEPVVSIDWTGAYWRKQA
jgi:O-methyltransferase